MKHPMLWEQSIHHFDLIRFIYKSNVKTVFATTSNPPWSMYKYDTNVNAILELQNGIIVNYIGNWQSNCKSLNFEWRTDCSKGIVVQKKQFDDLNYRTTNQLKLKKIKLKKFTMWVDDANALLSDFLKFFTQADVGVHDGYANVLKPTFSGIKAIEFTLGSIENREAVHCRAYSMLLDQLGFKTSDFLEFMEIPVMKKKEDYVLEFHGDTPENVAKTLAVFGAFVEGIQLFSSFAMMMNFSRFNKLPGMAKVVEWSLKDESMHIETCVTLYHDWLNENPQINKPELEEEIVKICKEMVQLEIDFIDFAFRDGRSTDGITAEELKQYVRSVADSRLEMLKINTIFGDENPLDWLNEIIYGTRHTSFFESKVTDYAKGSVEQSPDEDMGWDFAG